MMKAIVAFFVSFCAAASFAAAPVRSPEAAWSRALETGRQKIVSQAPQFQPVLMTIDRSSRFSAVISEPKLGLNVDLSRSGQDFWVNGYLKATGRASDGRSSLGGVSLMGGGVNVEARAFGGQRFVITGIYKDAEAKDRSMNVALVAEGQPIRDLAIHEKGLDLYLRWRATGYEIEGKLDPALYGRRELAILGATVAALTWDAFGR